MARFGYGFGLLPNMSPPADSGSQLAKLVESLSSAISKAKQIQGSIAGMLSDPDAADLAAAVVGLEGSIATAWGELVSAAQTADGARATYAALMAQGVPSQAPYQYPGGYQDWQNRALAPYNASVDQATRTMTAAVNYANGKRDVLAGLLASYNSNIQSAYEKVAEVRNAALAAKAAKNRESGATSDSHASQLQTQTFVAEQDLKVAQQKATAAAAAIAKPAGPSPLVIAAVAIPVLGVIAYALTRRKSASVAGYRRRKRRSRR